MPVGAQNPKQGSNHTPPTAFPALPLAPSSAVLLFTVVLNGEKQEAYHERRRAKKKTRTRSEQRYKSRDPRAPAGRRLDDPEGNGIGQEMALWGGARGVGRRAKL